MFKFLKSAKAILGMNARNLHYVGAYNSPQAISLANNKLRTNLALEKAGIPTPTRYMVVKSIRMLRKADLSSLPNSIVIKPRRGFGGEGVVLIYGRNKKGNWVKADGSEMQALDLKSHIYSILSGVYSKGGNSDWAIIEERLKISPELKPYSFKGAPDVRVIVFNHVPVMAQLRLPTKESQGRSNLHQGGIGVGIDLATGRTTNALYRGRMIKEIPGTKVNLIGLQIPHWKEILTMAVQCQDAIGLGYMGVDIVLDRTRGPVVIEVNARPGLSIQLANLAPLRSRLEKVADLEVKSATQGVRLAQDLFGSQEEPELEAVGVKPVIGAVENVVIFDSRGGQHTVLAKVDTGAYHSSIDVKLAEELGVSEVVLKKRIIKSALGEQERDIVPMKMIVAGVTIETRFSLADRKDMKYDMILGRRDLKYFLVDSSQKRPGKSSGI